MGIKFTWEIITCLSSSDDCRQVKKKKEGSATPRIITEALSPRTHWCVKSFCCCWLCTLINVANPGCNPRAGILIKKLSLSCSAVLHSGEKSAVRSFWGSLSVIPPHSYRLHSPIRIPRWLFDSWFGFFKHALQDLWELRIMQSKAKGLFFLMGDSKVRWFHVALRCNYLIIVTRLFYFKRLHFAFKWVTEVRVFSTEDCWQKQAVHDWLTSACIWDSSIRKGKSVLKLAWISCSMGQVLAV